MNIVFEGSPGSGKTTIINLLKQRLLEDNISVGYTVDIDEATPLYNILNDMHRNTPLVKNSYSFSTVLYESFIQGADYFYLREKMYAQNNQVNLFDRSYFSVYSYQKVLLKNEYGKCREFLHHFLKCLEYGFRDLDLIIYINTPLSISLKRAEIRDKTKYSDEEISTLKLFEKELINTISAYENKYNVLYIENIELEETVNSIYDYIVKTYNKRR